MKTLASLLAARAHAAPEAVALRGLDGLELTYASAWSRVEAISAALITRGIQAGDRVAIVLPNGPDAAIGFLGVASAATAAPLNPAYGREELAFYLGDLKARLAVVADPTAVPALSRAAEALSIPIVALADLLATGSGQSRPARASIDADSVALVLHTSGTTSRPKIVPLSHANLLASARQIAGALELTPDDRCLNIMPLFHVHGLVGAVLASLTAGASVVCTTGFDPEAFGAWLDRFQPTWYTGVPTMHQAIAARTDTFSARGRSRLRFVRSCSSALPPTLMAGLETALAVPVIEAYGMTECSHQLAINPLPPRARKPGSVGLACGTEIAVMDESGRLLPRGATGEIVVRGPGITRGYASPPEANARAFCDGWFRTGDQGHLDDDGYVFLTGRLKELINRGGEKIAPREIDEVLLRHPAVAQALAFAVPHLTLGEDVAAAVVLHPGRTATPDELREFAFQHLADFKVPSIVLLLDAIPKGPTGKPQRIGLAARLASRLASEHLPPRDEIEAVVADIWQEVLDRPQVGVHDNFFVVGGDSLRGSRVTTRINELFEIQLPTTIVFRHPTVEGLTAQVRLVAAPERLSEVAQTWREIQNLSDEEAARLLEETENKRPMGA